MPSKWRLLRSAAWLSRWLGTCGQQLVNCQFMLCARTTIAKGRAHAAHRCSCKDPPAPPSMCHALLPTHCALGSRRASTLSTLQPRHVPHVLTLWATGRCQGPQKIMLGRLTAPAFLDACRVTNLGSQSHGMCSRHLGMFESAPDVLQHLCNAMLLRVCCSVITLHLQSL
jgi:hypothetical protein